MYKFVTIYRRVDDEQRLEQFFNETHLPLAEKLPDLVHREVSRISHQPGGESRYHLMFELYFENNERFESAMTSPIGIQLVQALMPWVEAKIIVWFFADSFREDMSSND